MSSGSTTLTAHGRGGEKRHAGRQEWGLAALVLTLASALLMLPLWLQGAARGTICFIISSPATILPASSGGGELYPRWLMAMNGGFGSPTFFFYPPLPYYVPRPVCRARLPRPAGRLPCSAAPPLRCCSQHVCLSVAACHHFPWPGPGVSLLYLILPYHVAMDLYARFALAEFWAFAWAPLIPLGQDLAHRGRRQGLPC